MVLLLVEAVRVLLLLHAKACHRSARWPWSCRLQLHRQLLAWLQPAALLHLLLPTLLLLLLLRLRRLLHWRCP
jgi:hypothetical protein